MEWFLWIELSSNDDDREAPNVVFRNDYDLHADHNDQVFLPNGILREDAIGDAFLRAYRIIQKHT